MHPSDLHGARRLAASGSDRSGSIAHHHMARACMHGLKRQDHPLRLHRTRRAVQSCSTEPRCAPQRSRLTRPTSRGSPPSAASHRMCPRTATNDECWRTRADVRSDRRPLLTMRRRGVAITIDSMHDFENNNNNNSNDSDNNNAISRERGASKPDRRGQAVHKAERENAAF